MVVFPVLNERTSLQRAGIAQLARAMAFQAVGRGFESRFPLHIFRRVRMRL
jgi:hypothetical protein